eukprot:7961155-Pyramimonas_sp.AAC.1
MPARRAAVRAARASGGRRAPMAGRATRGPVLVASASRPRAATAGEAAKLALEVVGHAVV